MEKLHMIGTGTALSTKYYNTCYIIANKEGYLLEDGGSGNGILKRFKQMNLDWNRLHNVFVTHAHTDHVLGIIWVIRYVAYLMVEKDYWGELNIYCHQELKDIIETICKMLIRPAEAEMIGKRIHFHIVGDGNVRNVLGYEMTFFDIHSKKMKQFGFTMKLRNEKTLTCLGDEPYHLVNKKYVENADWLLAEAFCLYEDKEIYWPYRYHHSTVRDACELAETLHVKNLILYHTEDYEERKEKFIREGRKYFSGNILVPEDMEVINLDESF